MMVKWALDKCEAEGRPAFVTSTVEALPFYEKLGFEVAGRISMELGEVSKCKATGLYEEIICVYTPTKRGDLGVLDTY
jgi:hypothetical protein